MIEVTGAVNQQLHPPPNSLVHCTDEASEGRSVDYDQLLPSCPYSTGNSGLPGQSWTRSFGMAVTYNVARVDSDRKDIQAKLRIQQSGLSTCQICA